MNVFVLTFLFFIITANSYLAYKFISVFRNYLPVPVWSVILIWIFLTAAGIIFRNETNLIPAGMSDFLYMMGAYWIAIIYYALLIVLLCDIIGLLQRFSGVVIFGQSAQVTGGLVIILLFALMIYGSYNATNPKAVYYKVNIDKPAQTSSMRIVLLSDMHLGRINDEVLVKKTATIINELKPDVVFLAGDTVDSDLNSVIRKNPLADFVNLDVRYGIYGILGNHEYIGQSGNLAAEYLEKKNIKMLIDQGVELPNGVYVYGRDDFSSHKNVQTLPTVENKPFIIVDHQPRRIKDAIEVKADMMFSGHTHRGQLFPNNFITQRIYEVDHGHKIIDGLNVFVSTGLGTWGPPVRIGSRSEIICIDVSFKQ